MTERNPFSQNPAREGLLSDPGHHRVGCEDWEILLADALDDHLSSEDKAAFESHGTECSVCAQLLTHARQGREWMHFLEGEPEIPSGMVERILSKTSEAAIGTLAGAVSVPAAIHHGTGTPVRRMVWDTHLLMTAAMAFFSIALTLNLAGVRLTNLRLADLTPASMEMNLTRQFYGTESSLVRYYNNLRFVWELESRMREFKRDEQMQSVPEQQKQDVPQNPKGNGHKNGGRLDLAPKPPAEGQLWGQPTLASLEPSIEEPLIENENKKEETHAGNLCDEDQAQEYAERSLI